MNVIKIPVSKCKAGDILAKDVLNRKGVTLVAKDLVINQYIIDRLTCIGIKNLWIYSTTQFASEKTPANYERVVKSYKEIILTTKEFLTELTSKGTFNSQKLDILSELLQVNLNCSGNVIKCLHDIRNADTYTYTHCVNVAFYAMLTASWIKLPKENIKEVIKTGLLHDIGKVFIPDEILNKQDRLLEEEFTLMKRHSFLGYDCLKQLTEISEPVKKAVLSHHERLDGSGYPNGIGGDEINLYAKIIAIADVYDAMTQVLR